jgi:hypothetical protein
MVPLKSAGLAPRMKPDEPIEFKRAIEIGRVLIAGAMPCGRIVTLGRPLALMYHRSRGGADRGAALQKGMCMTHIPSASFAYTAGELIA